MPTLGELLAQKKQEQMSSMQGLYQGIGQGSAQATQQANQIGQAQVANEFNPVNALVKGGATALGAMATGGASLATVPLALASGMTAKRGQTDIGGSALQGGATGIVSKGLDASTLGTPEGLKKLSTVGKSMLGTPQESMGTIGDYATTQIAQDSANKLSTISSTLRPFETATSKDEAKSNLESIKSFPETHKEEINALTPEAKKEFNKAYSDTTAKAQTTYNALVVQEQKGSKITTNNYKAYISKLNKANTVEEMGKVIEEATKDDKTNAEDIKVLQSEYDRKKGTIEKKQQQDRDFSLKTKIFQQKVNSQGNISKLFTEEDKQYWTDYAIQNGGKLPVSFGRTAQGQLFTAEIMKRMSEQETSAGHTAGSTLANKALVSAKTDALKKVSSLKALVGNFEKTTIKNMDILDKTLDKLPDSGSPVANSIMRSIGLNVSGSTDITKFNTAQQTVINEASRVLNTANGNGVVSDTARKEVQEIFKKGATKKQIKSAMEILRKDMKSRMDSLDETQSDIFQDISNSGSNPKDPLGVL